MSNVSTSVSGLARDDKMKEARQRVIELMSAMAALSGIFVALFMQPSIAASVQLASEMAVYFGIFILLAFLVYLFEAFDYSPTKRMLRLFRYYTTILMFIFFSIVLSFLFVIGLLGNGYFIGSPVLLQLVIIFPSMVLIGGSGMYFFQRNR